jgi:peptide deformylase
MQGVLFHDRMTPKVLATIKDSLVELEEAYLREHPGAQVQRV